LRVAAACRDIEGDRGELEGDSPRRGGTSPEFVYDIARDRGEGDGGKEFRSGGGIVLKRYAWASSRDSVDSRLITWAASAKARSSRICQHDRMLAGYVVAPRLERATLTDPIPVGGLWLYWKGYTCRALRFALDTSKVELVQLLKRQPRPSLADETKRPRVLSTPPGGPKDHSLAAMDGFQIATLLSRYAWSGVQF
jgi:hypothetical protein